MLQYYPPIYDGRHINFTKVDFMNETNKIGLSQINFEIINTPKMDNSGRKFALSTKDLSISLVRILWY